MYIFNNNYAIVNSIRNNPDVGQYIDTNTSAGSSDHFGCGFCGKAASKKICSASCHESINRGQSSATLVMKLILLSLQMVL